MPEAQGKPRAAPAPDCSHKVPSRSPPPHNSSRGRRAREAAPPGLRRLRMETPAAFPAWGTRARIQQRREQGQKPAKSLSDARDLLLQALSGFSKGRVAQPVRPRRSTPLLSPQVPPNSSREAPSSPDGAPKLPEHSPATPTPVSRTLLVAFSPPRAVLLAFTGSQKQTTRKCLREEPPYTRPVTETKAQGGGRWKRRREEGLERGWGER